MLWGQDGKLARLKLVLELVLLLLLVPLAVFHLSRGETDRARKVLGAK